MSTIILINFSILIRILNNTIYSDSIVLEKIKYIWSLIICIVRISINLLGIIIICNKYRKINII